MFFQQLNKKISPYHCQAAVADEKGSCEDTSHVTMTNSLPSNRVLLWKISQKPHVAHRHQLQWNVDVVVPPLEKQQCFINISQIMPDSKQPKV